MIIKMQADIFSLQVQALVNPVNCVGIMGKGLAKAFKEHYPENFLAYRQYCLEGKLQIGGLFVYGQSPIIVNLPTKKHWRSKSTLESIEAGIKALALYLEANHIESVAIPKLGCGLGGLNYEEILPLLERHLEPLATQCYLL